MHMRRVQNTESPFAENILIYCKEEFDFITLLFFGEHLNFCNLHSWLEWQHVATEIFC